MHNLKSTALFFVVILCLTSVLQAGTNKYGVADVRKVTLTAATRVGDVVCLRATMKSAMSWKLRIT